MDRLLGLATKVQFPCEDIEMQPMGGKDSPLSGRVVKQERMGALEYISHLAGKIADKVGNLIFYLGQVISSLADRKVSLKDRVETEWTQHEFIMDIHKQLADALSDKPSVEMQPSAASPKSSPSWMTEYTSPVDMMDGEEEEMQDIGNQDTLPKVERGGEVYLQPARATWSDD